MEERKATPAKSASKATAAAGDSSDPLSGLDPLSGGLEPLSSALDPLSLAAATSNDLDKV